MAETAKGRRLVFSVSIRDCRVDTFTCGGRGGSGKDTSNNGVRVVHEPSGAVGECREERHQHINRVRAFHRMAETPEFKAWHRRVLTRMMGSTPPIEDVVEAWLNPILLKIEVHDAQGRWKEVDYDSI